MGSTVRYRLHGMLIGGATWITAYEDLTPEAAVQAITRYPASGVHPSFRGSTGARPIISFTTPQVSTVLGLCGLTAYDASAANVDLYYRAIDRLGEPIAIATASHLRLRLPAAADGKGGAMLTWNRIMARQDDIATITCQFSPTWDATNAPITPAGSVAIPAISLPATFHTLGPVSLSGTAVDGVEEWDLDMGTAPSLVAADGEAYASWAALNRQDPILTVQTPDLGQWVTLTLDGAAATAAVFYLRHLAANGDLVAEATETHVSFTGTDNPCAHITPLNSRGGEPGGAMMGLRVAFEQSNAASAHPLTLDTTAAIA